MKNLPTSVRPVLRRLRRRLAIGLFLETWPRSAVASLLLGGLVTLICRIFFAPASAFLNWLWLAPVLAGLPSIVVCVKRAYRPAEIVALADSLSGGEGTLMTLFETGDARWADAPAVKRLSRLALPRLRPWRQLGLAAAAAAFLMATLLVPQRTAGGTNAILADDIAAELQATLAELKKQNLITPDEEKKLDQEIQRIRTSALDRVDSSSWEAADALREQVAGDLSRKHDALKWAAETLARYGAAEQSGATNSEKQSGEMARAIEKLAAAGLLSDAPPELQRLLGSASGIASGRVQLPADTESARRVRELLSKHLDGLGQRFGAASRLGREFGRFDPSEFPLSSYELRPDGYAGSGGVDRGRGDAMLTWGKESAPFDRFKATALPPGAARRPDEWVPVAVLPGAPKESPEVSGPAPIEQYAGAAGQAAWRRTLAPRHRSAVKKYFEDAR